VTSKLCYRCNNEKPEHDFYSDSKGGLKTWCKQCCLEHAKLYQQAHPEKKRDAFRKRMLDPLKRAIHNAQHNAQYHAKHPEALTVTEWIKLRRKHRTQSIQQKIKNLTSRIAANYGQPLADLYSKNPFVPWSKSSSPTPSGPKLQQLKAQLISSQTGIKNVKQATIQRVEALNRSCSLPLLSIGWHCLRCGIFHKNPWFFDIDHITPKSQGGSNHHSNKQCLCPTCHRLKTLAIDGTQPSQSFKSVNPLQLLLA